MMIGKSCETRGGRGVSVGGGGREWPTKRKRENEISSVEILTHVAYLYARYDDEILYSRYVVFSFDEMTIFIISLE